MISSNPLPTIATAVALVLLSITHLFAQEGTRIKIETPVGNLTLELYDEEKPVTVANFLAYIESGRFEGVFAHRLVPGFVLQSGGYTLENGSPSPVPSDPPIVNEFTSDPKFSNTFGTIAMAKVGGMPDSATSQWFLNLGNNSDLDSNNGGFTVFGRVVAGLDVLARFNTDFNDGASGNRGIYDASPAYGSAFATLPLLAGSLSPQNFVYTEVRVDAPTPPTLSIKGKKRLKTKRSRVVLKGSATASEGLDRVEYKLPGSRARTAKGNANWSIKAKLRPGRNVIKIWAFDYSGQRSGIQKRTIIRKR